MKSLKAEVDYVIPGSIAEELEIEKGDIIISVNSERPQDLIDYKFLIADETIELEVMKPDGESWVCEIEKDEDEDLGLVFTQDVFDGIRRCANRCVFCFVDQMPPNMRESLYIKDDDFRMSFLHGNFVTLTNLTDRDVSRITRMHLSPLYISVHATDENVRERMLNNKKAKNIVSRLKTLAQAGIEMHTQVVLCPDINDKDVLRRTIDDLAGLWPNVASLAIVPVGLTAFREELSTLRTFTSEEALQLVKEIESLQKQFVKKLSVPFVYLADEFYMMAGLPIPSEGLYDEYPQLENGVGLVRIFLDSFDKVEKSLPSVLANEKHIGLVTGISGAKVLNPIVNRLNLIDKLNVEIVPVVNRFFGEKVTVAGLLTGIDILKTVKGQSFDYIILPSVMFKRDSELFLDGMTASELSKQLGYPVLIADLDCGALDFIEKVVKGG